MTAGVVAPKPATRRVRVVIEGDARPLAHTPRLLVVDYDGRTALVDSESASVTVEEVEPPRTWTSGDAVVHAGLVWSRDPVDRWRTPSQPEWSISDGNVNAALELRPDTTEVLRYQAGDQ